MLLAFKGSEMHNYSWSIHIVIFEYYIKSTFQAYFPFNLHLLDTRACAHREHNKYAYILSTQILLSVLQVNLPV